MSLKISLRRRTYWTWFLALVGLYLLTVIPGLVFFLEKLRTVDGVFYIGALAVGVSFFLASGLVEQAVAGLAEGSLPEEHALEESLAEAKKWLIGGNPIGWIWILVLGGIGYLLLWIFGWPPEDEEDDEEEGKVDLLPKKTS